MTNTSTKIEANEAAAKTETIALETRLAQPGSVSREPWEEISRQAIERRQRSNGRGYWGHCDTCTLS